MNQEFKQYVKNKKIIPFPEGKTLVRRELDISRGDLSDAMTGFQNELYKWSTIQAYFAMRHAAKALVYSRGYRGKGHYSLVIALKALYVDTNLMEINVVREFINAMNLREVAEYEAEYSILGAKAVISAAERLIELAGNILNMNE